VRKRVKVQWKKKFFTGAHLVEMKDFLDGGDDLSLRITEQFRLTPPRFYEHTGSRKFLDHPDDHGRARRPHPISGAMFLKVLKAPAPRK
jgi:hypothetical protein